MKKRFFFLFIVLFLINNLLVIKGYEPEEVKVALILKILEYTDWPNFDTGPIYIGVIEGGNILKYLKQIPEDYLVKGRKIIVNKLRKRILNRNIKKYRVIIIPKEVEISNKDIENFIKHNKDVLIISEDIKNHCDYILITFFVKEDAIKIKVYFENLPKFNISFDETLLRYAYEK